MGKKLPDDLNTLKVTELKEALKERSLTVSGNKAELVGRLQEFLNKQGAKVFLLSLNLIRITYFAHYCSAMHKI
jgi:hypothetical protein